MHKIDLIDLTVPIEITDEFVLDVIVTMFEGGSNYWIDHVECDIEHKPKGMPVSEWITKQILEMKEVMITDNEWHERVPFTYHKFIDGLKMWVKQFPDHVTFDSVDMGKTLIDSGNIDANEADLILQLAVFDEVVFG